MSRHDDLSALFEEASAIDPDERSAFLATISDTGLRNDLRLLLLSDDDCDGFLSGSASMPRRIGRFEILSVIGQGGMGVVYRAMQHEPSREVALKVINPGLLSDRAGDRLRREADVLARLRHSGIAQIYEAGTEAVGGVAQPYFAMELIEGRPLTAHAEHEQLGVPERIALLIGVCEAVQYAHTKGVIHRDLKPGNVLVEETGGGNVKVLDFGIAVVSDLDVETSIATMGTSGLEGTLAYMSPEQVRGESDIDTRSDVYALGVIAYRLLTGSLPIESESGSLAEITRRIAEVDPVRASRRDPRLRGDLDTIIHKALEKERDRRYPSAAAMAEDLEAFLEHRPVSARPATIWYQLHKAARRNRAVAAAACIAVLAIIVGVAAMAFGLVRAERNARLADQRAVEKEAEAERARAAVDFYAAVLLGVDPAVHGADIPFMDVLSLAALRAGNLVHQPRLEGDVRYSLGFIFRRHARYAEAEQNLRRSVQLLQKALGPDHEETAPSLHALAQVLREYRGAYAEALALMDDVVRIYEPRSDINSVFAKLDRAVALMELERYEEADHDIQLSIEALIRDAGPDTAWINIPMIQLAELRLREGRFAEAREACERGIAASPPGLRQEFPRARLLLRLARIELLEGSLEEAQRVIDEADELLGALLAPEHLLFADLNATRCRVLLAMERWDEALVAANACRRIRQQTLHPDHWRHLEAEMLVAVSEGKTGLPQRARATLEDLMETCRSRLGAAHRLTLEMHRALHEAYVAMGLHTHAESIRGRLEYIERLRQEAIETD